VSRRSSRRNRNLVVSAVIAGLALAASAKGHSVTTASTSAVTRCGGSNEALANCMAAAAPYGWTGGQTVCLDELWTRESGFLTGAVNGQTGATGIPQLNPAYYAVPADWTSEATQIRWGLWYVAGRYGTPCAAWSHEEDTSWY
jgi:hypothetical protein